MDHDISALALIQSANFLACYSGANEFASLEQYQNSLWAIIAAQAIIQPTGFVSRMIRNEMKKKIFKEYNTLKEQKMAFNIHCNFKYALKQLATVIRTSRNLLHGCLRFLLPRDSSLRCWWKRILAGLATVQLLLTCCLICNF